VAMAAEAPPLAVAPPVPEPPVALPPDPETTWPPVPVTEGVLEEDPHEAPASAPTARQPARHTALCPQLRRGDSFPASMEIVADWP
jgi:hypothetical protein